jgi:hypothetical protein
MNAAEKAKILKANGYHYRKDPVRFPEYIWFFDGVIVAQEETSAQATHAAYAHYEAQQEALAQAANDAAGEAAYNEAVADATEIEYAYNQTDATLEREGKEALVRLRSMGKIDFGANAPEAPSCESLLEEIATLRQQLADARDDLRRLAEMVLDPVWTGEIEIFAQKALDRLNANPKFAYAEKPAPVADAPKYKVGDKVRIKWADYLHGKYEEVEAFDGTVYALKDIPVVFEPFELEPYTDAPQPLAEGTLIQPLPKFMIRQHVSLLGHPVMVQEIRQHNGENQYRIQFRTLSDLKNPPFSAYNWWNENELRAYDTVLPTCPDCGNSGMLRTGGACPCGAMA